jgi:hypothetical protein
MRSAETNTGVRLIGLRAPVDARWLLLVPVMLAAMERAVLAQTPPPPTNPPPAVSSAPHIVRLPATGEITNDIYELNAWYKGYEAFKQQLQTSYDIQYDMQVSTFTQWGTPHGTPGSVQVLYTPTITWTPFNDPEIGSGAFTFAFQQEHYWTRATAAAQQARMGLLTPPNGQVSNGYEYVQATYAHTLPGAWSWLSVSVGQYEFDSFDNNQYADSAQTNFINYALSQNGSQAYATAGLGAYVQEALPGGQFTFAEGYQTSNDVSGASVTTRGLAAGPYDYFLYAQWVPAFLPGATYSVIWYTQPGVPQFPSGSQGISFSAVQNFGDKWGLFLRANNASGAVSPIETSLGWGAIYNDPFRHSKLDQVGLGFFWSKTNFSAIDQPARKSETGIELYYNYALFKGLHIAPDVQLYINPALAPTSGPAVMFTLRTTAFF